MERAPSRVTGKGEAHARGCKGLAPQGGKRPQRVPAAGGGAVQAGTPTRVAPQGCSPCGASGCSWGCARSRGGEGCVTAVLLPTGQSRRPHTGVRAYALFDQKTGPH